MTEPQILEAEAACAAATPGPWGTDAVDWKVNNVISSDRICTCHDSDSAEFTYEKNANGRFIAVARTALPSALAMIRKLQAEAIERGIGFSNMRLVNEGMIAGMTAADARTAKAIGALQLIAIVDCGDEACCCCAADAANARAALAEIDVSNKSKESNTSPGHVEAANMKIEGTK